MAACAAGRPAAGRGVCSDIRRGPKTARRGSALSRCRQLRCPGPSGRTHGRAGWRSQKRRRLQTSAIWAHSGNTPAFEHRTGGPYGVSTCGLVERALENKARPPGSELEAVGGVVRVGRSPGRRAPARGYPPCHRRHSVLAGTFQRVGGLGDHRRRRLQTQSRSGQRRPPANTIFLSALPSPSVSSENQQLVIHSSLGLPVRIAGPAGDPKPARAHRNDICTGLASSGNSFSEANRFTFKFLPSVIWAMASSPPRKTCSPLGPGRLACWS